MTGRTDANDHVTTYGYDAAHRLTSVTDPLDRATTYAYDADSNPVKLTTPRGSTTRTYDVRGLVTKIDYSDATPDVTLGYDDAGQILTRKYSDGNTIGYTYDNDGRTATRAGPADRPSESCRSTDLVTVLYGEWRNSLTKSGS